MGLAREVMFSVEEDPDTDEYVDPGCEDDGRDGDMVIYQWGMLMTAKQMPYCLTSIWHRARRKPSRYKRHSQGVMPFQGYGSTLAAA